MLKYIIFVTQTSYVALNRAKLPGAHWVSDQNQLNDRQKNLQKSIEIAIRDLFS